MAASCQGLPLDFNTDSILIYSLSADVDKTFAQISWNWK